MVMSTVGRLKNFRNGNLILATALLLLMLVSTGFAVETEPAQHYKLISTVEYTGQGQFRNQVEGLFTVEKKDLSNNKVQYFISAKDMFDNLSFIVDRNAQQLSQVTGCSDIWAQVNNSCARSLEKVTQANIGKTWEQAFDLSKVSKQFPAELGFTMTAIRLENNQLGDMIAVRALSEPFFVSTQQGNVTSRINTIYLFDSEIEDIFLSASVFESSTTMNGFKETLWHKIATCKSDASGKTVEFKGLGKKFEKFASKLALTKNIKITKPADLPQWSQDFGLKAAQVSGICSSLACEGAMNPVTTVSASAAKIIELQKEMRTASYPLATNTGTTNPTLASSNPPGPWEWLVEKTGSPWLAGGIVGGAIAIPMAGGGGGGGSGAVSP